MSELNRVRNFAMARAVRLALGVGAAAGMIGAAGQAAAQQASGAPSQHSVPDSIRSYTLPDDCYAKIHFDQLYAHVA